MRAAPATGKERIETLDIVRGIALLGILLANMVSFKSPIFQNQSLPSELGVLPPGIINQISVLFLDLFITGKFYPLFSFLFGLGFYLFYSRLVEKGLQAAALFKNRMAFLLGLGLFHLILLWSGDILHTYAVAGFFLLLFIGRSTKTILSWSIGLITFSAVIVGGLTTAGNLLLTSQSGSTYESQAQQTISEAETAYNSGSFTELFMFRLTDEIPVILGNIFFTVPNVLGIFLIGLYVGKKGWITHSVDHLKTWRKIQLYTMVPGIAAAIIFALFTNNLVPFPTWLTSGLAEGLNIVGGPLLMLFYMATAMLFFQKQNRIRLAQPLASVGKMALTNYLLQTILCIMIFYGFGLGLYGAIDAATGILITIIIFAAQVILSFLWLQSHQQGPMEKVWRKWTYR
ncbi:DUF418 domain-containing protein [Alteribacillus sp. HJP-4]|uniref:DUF418 domain-containing protein n=1 Tax=Alteribacillus sp. HJP-4 TaxID=2775394 RepID=UPI0035CD218D